MIFGFSCLFSLLRRKPEIDERVFCLYHSIGSDIRSERREPRIRAMPRTPPRPPVQSGRAACAPVVQWKSCGRSCRSGTFWSCHPQTRTRLDAGAGWHFLGSHSILACVARTPDKGGQPWKVRHDSGGVRVKNGGPILRKCGFDSRRAYHFFCTSTRDSSPVTVRGGHRAVRSRKTSCLSV